MTKLTETQREMLTEEEQGWFPCGYPANELLRRLAEARERGVELYHMVECRLGWYAEGYQLVYCGYPTCNGGNQGDTQELLDEAWGKIEKYELFLCKLRDMTYRAPELFPTNEVATYAHQLGVEADGILCEIDK